MNYQNIRKAKAIERQNKERLLKVNPKLNEKSGIYFLLREDENSFKFAYIGQASISILQRLASHMVGYQQHIDKSLKAHGLYSEKNPYGWRVQFLNFPVIELDEREKFYIKQYADAGYQLLNVSVGGQGSERSSGQIGQRKESKGYRDGLRQGYTNAVRDIKGIIDKHLIVSLKPEKANNKVSQKQFEKFKEILNGE